MASVTLEHVKKIYDGGVVAVQDFNLEIKDKEFVVFVGPSGCGKSTTLRMVAGLEEITDGELLIIGNLPVAWNLPMINLKLAIVSSIRLILPTMPKPNVTNVCAIKVTSLM